MCHSTHLSCGEPQTHLEGLHANLLKKMIKKKKEGYCILVTLYVHTERNGGIDRKHKLHYQELAVELEVEELMWLRINYCNEGVLTLSLKR